MNLSRETQEDIRRFASEEAGKHLNSAEISYFERLGRKTGQTKDKIIKKMSKFKLTSQQTMEARDDLTLYMSDHIADLVEQGHTENEALEMAKAALKADSGSDQSADIRDKYMEYFQSRNPAMDEAVGLYYGGFSLLGIIVGAVAGLLLGLNVFPGYFCLTLIISIVVGMLVGVACAMLKHASVAEKSR